ncbi:hypothetical protein BDZ94DRAFT_1258736 [Collybia nuda]|uniref:DUF6593 domain-containing protein n=1 Tax=Collybia nuda TaxID=64659 RepID=A0A9P5Y672_9AGAR|nr:hypothetical protein BDZ94DRAFT_1258736 [Collybia nuda]
MRYRPRAHSQIDIVCLLLRTDATTNGCSDCGLRRRVRFRLVIFAVYLTTVVCVHVQLIVNDDSKTPVAEFHRGSLGIIGKARPASLEIFEAGEHMIETILVTFIYIEKIRKDKERAAR